MFRTIAATIIVFAFAAFALHRSPGMGLLEEPLLLLFMGTLFLIVGKMLNPPRARAAVEPVLPEARR